ncbi:MAG: hypothetical protein NTW28_32360, partial [Candidatus Solibacter sp.]|nr:hypothetical protein [Candidatus Solibacter sp.]
MKIGEAATAILASITALNLSTCIATDSLASLLHYQLRKVNAELMNLLLAAVLVVLGLVLLLLFLQFRKLSDLSGKETDWAPVLNNLGVVQKGQEQVDRSVREEISRNRQEHSTQSQALRSEVVTALTGMGDSVSTKVEGLTRSNDQKLELVRSGMEQRLDSFSTESGRKIDSLTQSVATSSGKLQDEVSVRLVEFKNSLEGT